MSLRRRHTIFAVLATVVLFPIGLFAFGLPAGLLAMVFQAPADTLFMLSWLPPFVSILAVSRLMDWKLSTYARWPVLAVYLVVASCGLVIALLGEVAAPAYYGVIWCVIVVGTACLCHWPGRDQLKPMRPLP